MDSNEPIVWNEPVLDEYWDRFEAENAQRKLLDSVRDICTVHFENVEIKKERIAALVDICSSGSANNIITKIIFNNVNLCEEGITWLSKLVDVSSELQLFCLRHNWIDNMESARCLSRSLKSHTCINTLSLAHCDLGSSPEILLAVLQSDIRYIGLSNNNIDSFGAVTIAEYLESNPPIYHIDLEHNRLNDNDASLISQALKRNTHLGQIDIFANNITSIGAKALLSCVFDSSSLNSILESNHILVSMNILYEESNKNLHDCIKRLLELDQFQKIMLALQDKDSLLKYLANVPAELLPEVLAFPRGRIADERKHKHLMYSTMRWWNMPMLYSYHNCAMSDAKRKRDD
jgi:hypothetical protein